MLSVSNLNAWYGASHVLQDVGLDVNKGEIVCLIGRNGAGKTTLVRTITGQIEPDTGKIEMPRGTTLGYIAQEAPSGQTTPFETVLEADKERTALMAESETCQDPDRLGDVYERLIAIDAYTAPARASTILVGLGFSETLLYTLVPKGSFEVSYPLASDKSALREAIAPKLKESLAMNARNAELLGLETVRAAHGELDHDLRALARGQPPRLQVTRDADHLQLAVAEDRVDREAHEEHVDRACRPEEHPLVRREARDLEPDPCRQLREVAQPLDRTVRDLDAAVHDDDPSRSFFELRQGVRRQQDRCASGGKPLDHFVEGQAQLRIETRGRFVQQQHPWLPDQRLRKPQALPHALGIGAHATAGGGAKADDIEQLQRLVPNVPSHVRSASGCLPARPWGGIYFI